MYGSLLRRSKQTKVPGSAQTMTVLRRLHTSRERGSLVHRRQSIKSYQYGSNSGAALLRTRTSVAEPVAIAPPAPPSPWSASNITSGALGRSRPTPLTTSPVLTRLPSCAMCSRHPLPRPSPCLRAALVPRFEFVASAGRP